MRRGIRRGYYTDNREDALIMWRDARRPSPERRAQSGVRTSSGIEDVVRRDRRPRLIWIDSATTRADPRAEIERRRSQAELHARYGGVVPEIASRRHLELVSPVIREALDQAERSLDDVDTVAVTAGPGLIGALLVGVSPPPRRSPGARGLPLVPVNHLHGHVASLYLQPLDLEPPFTCLLASGGHTLLLDVRDRDWGGARVLGTHARRRGRRGLRQGRAPARAPATRAAPRSTGSRARATPRPTPSPSRACPGSTSRSPG